MISFPKQPRFKFNTPMALSTRQTHALLIGDTTGMQRAISTLLRCCDSAIYFRQFPDLSELTFSPELILVCQQWPEEYTRDEISLLLETFPLSRIVVSYSAWCASDGRTRDLWPIAIRVDLNLAARRIQQELEVLEGVRSPLPLTAGYDEIFVFDQSH